ncbi:hypothetical protein FD755_015199 [Muntiacus reevesi]|uniref:Angiopoietin-2 n=1 Tax=Muntiacus reevesi TaxID=9886 RepID=A0A5N3XI00_MUNRE|nr:hypothetical protein FD755_015199 [Muntiacus reevesi]
MWQLVFLTLSCDLAVATAHSGSRKGMDIAAGKKQYQVQHGACSYTFLLPETDHCRSPPSAYVPNAVQRDAPLDYDDSVQRLQVLENIMENNTQWLMKPSALHSLLTRGVASNQRTENNRNVSERLALSLWCFKKKYLKFTDVQIVMLNLESMQPYRFACLEGKLLSSTSARGLSGLSAREQVRVCARLLYWLLVLE